MKRDEFLQIFTTGFHKLSLKKVVKYGSGKTEIGKPYDDLLGLFEFEPPACVWNDPAPIDYDFLKQVASEFNEELSNCIVRKFTRKIFREGKLSTKKVVRYIFDIIPKNVVEFRFDTERKKMRLVVKGFRINS